MIGFWPTAAASRRTDALEELAGATRSVLESHAELADKHTVELRHQLRPRSVPSDPVLLERLMTNLVANAIVHNQPGQHVPAEEVPALLGPSRRLGADRTSHLPGDCPDPGSAHPHPRRGDGTRRKRPQPGVVGRVQAQKRPGVDTLVTRPHSHGTAFPLPGLPS